MTSQEASEKKSILEQFANRKDSQTISDEDLLKYTGKTRDEFDSWKQDRAGVGANQLAGNLTLGSAAGLTGAGAASGVGGWGPSSGESGQARGLKFPPQKQDGKQEEPDD